MSSRKTKFDAICTVRFIEDDYGRFLIVGRESGCLQRYNAARLGDGDDPLIEMPRAHNGAITGIVAQETSSFLTGSVDGTVRAWQINMNADEEGGELNGKSEPCKQQEMISLSDAADGIRCLYQDPQGDRWTFGGCTKGRIAIIKNKGANGKHKIGGYLNGHSGAVVSITSMPDTGLIISGSHDGTLRGWNKEQRHCTFVFRGHTSHVQAVLTAEGTFPPAVMSAGGDKVILWTLPEENEIAEGGGGDGEEEEDEETSASTTVASAPRLVTPKAVLPIPAAPTCANAEFNNGTALLGLSGNLLMSLDVKRFLRQSQMFHDKNTASIEKKETKLKSQASKMVVSAQRVAQKSTQRLGAENLNIRQEDDEEEDDEEARSAVTVDSQSESRSDENNENLNQNRVQVIQHNLQRKETAINKALQTRCKSLELLKKQTCEFSAAAYNTQSFCNIVARFPESVTAVTVDANTGKMFAVVGDQIRSVPFRHQVSIL